MKSFDVTEWGKLLQQCYPIWIQMNNKIKIYFIRSIGVCISFIIAYLLFHAHVFFGKGNPNLIDFWREYFDRIIYWRFSPEGAIAIYFVGIFITCIESIIFLFISWISGWFVIKVLKTVLSVHGQRDFPNEKR